jgi:hypothetical protein
MPYPFAHPAAVIPLAPLMGRLAVPSALAIGSMLPDLWYFVPMVTRVQSHSAAGLLWFCLPLGLLAYAVFHLVLKEPLIALLSARLQTYACRGLPKAPWHAVLVSLGAGAATHLVWDALTHSNDYALHGHNWAQHASTALGSLLLARWAWHRVARAPAHPSILSLRSRICTGALLAAIMAAAALAGGADGGNLRTLVRSAGMAALQAAAVAIFVYCAVWHLRTKRTGSA